MDLLQVREKEIFETLKLIKNNKFVVIGGYATNAYTLPRFSVDCDIVVKDNEEANKIIKKLKGIEYKKQTTAEPPYKGDFKRYEKKIKENFFVSMDILIKEVHDRQTNTCFSFDWVFKNSKIRVLKGKTVVDNIEVKIINIDALIVMKMISCRKTDIRDVFMLLSFAKNTLWIKKEISKLSNFDERYKKFKDKITSKQFKDNLQGVFGYINEKVFEKHVKAVLTLEIS